LPPPGDIPGRRLPGNGTGNGTAAPPAVRPADSSPPEPFEPFANEAEVLSVGADLTIENRRDRVTLVGSVDLTLDREGRRKAEALKRLLDRVTAALAAGEPLPERVETTAPERVDNPFE
jgi:hypothetical protein